MSGDCAICTFRKAVGSAERYRVVEVRVGPCSETVIALVLKYGYDSIH